MNEVLSNIRRDGKLSELLAQILGHDNETYKFRIIIGAVNEHGEFAFLYYNDRYANWMKGVFDHYRHTGAKSHSAFRPGTDPIEVDKLNTRRINLILDKLKAVRDGDGTWENLL